MSDGYQIRGQNKVHYLTLQVVFWIDIFTRKRYKDMVIESLKYCQQHKSLEIYAYVIMSNHVHIIVRSENENLSQTLCDFKKYTSKAIIESIKNEVESRREWLLMMFEKAAKRHQRNRYYQVWTHENHAVELYSDKFVSQKLHYIHNNPVRAGIVVRPEDYLYSSARNYFELEALMEVKKVPLWWKTYH